MDMFEAEKAQKKLYDMKPHELYMHLALQGEWLLLGYGALHCKQPTTAALVLTRVVHTPHFGTVGCFLCVCVRWQCIQLFVHTFCISPLQAVG
jgi:hypothetical protein